MTELLLRHGMFEMFLWRLTKRSAVVQACVPVSFAILCRPNALANSPIPARKPSNQLEAPRTLGEIPGSPESHAQNLAHAGIGEFAHSKCLKRSKSTGQEGDEEDLTAEELEMQPLWQQNGHSDSTGLSLSGSALISLSMLLFITVTRQATHAHVTQMRLTMSSFQSLPIHSCAF